MMGCKMSFLPDLSSWGLAGLAVEEEKEGEVKQYSWDKLRVELDLSQYVIDSQDGGEVVRRPGKKSAGSFWTLQQREMSE